mmetsp:Transcript_15569/g.43563  ORF Transcript_15569/g.43563 Transcript_15569/m.43563 type:complete len:204 (+) Transcript_15569:67-678(+)
MSLLTWDGEARMPAHSAHAAPGLVSTGAATAAGLGLLEPAAGSSALVPPTPLSGPAATSGPWASLAPPSVLVAAGSRASHPLAVQSTELRMCARLAGRSPALWQLFSTTEAFPRVALVLPTPCTTVASHQASSHHTSTCSPFCRTPPTLAIWGGGAGRRKNPVPGRCLWWAGCKLGTLALSAVLVGNHSCSFLSVSSSAMREL